jgi:hypothetical protein
MQMHAHGDISSAALQDAECRLQPNEPNAGRDDQCSTKHNTKAHITSNGPTALEPNEIDHCSRARWSARLVITPWK